MRPCTQQLPTTTLLTGEEGPRPTTLATGEETGSSFDDPIEPVAFGEF